MTHFEELVLEARKAFDNAAVKVVGVGGAGILAAMNVARDHTPGVGCVAVDTDYACLIGGATAVHRFVDFSDGNDDVNYNRLSELIGGNGTKVVVVLAGMGGKIGTTMASRVAEVARKAGKVTVVMATLPFLFESQSRIDKAVEGARALDGCADALMVFNNQHLVAHKREYNADDAFDLGYYHLADSVMALNGLSNGDGGTSIDIDDVCGALRDSRFATISTASASGENRVERAVNQALNSPMLIGRNARNAKKIIVQLRFSPDSKKQLKVNEVMDISNWLSAFDEGVDVLFGTVRDSSLRDDIAVTLLATGQHYSLDHEYDPENL